MRCPIALPTGLLAVGALLAATSCAGASRPAAGELGASAAGATAERCTIGGTADELLVVVPGLAASALRATGVPAELAFALEPRLERALAHVLAPIDVRGEARLDAVHLVVARTLVPGALTVIVGAPVARPAIDESRALRGLVSIDGGRTDPAVSAVLSVGCGDLALGDHLTADSRSDDTALPTHELVGAQDLSLSVSPGGPTALTLAFAERETPLQVTVIEERDGWAHVTRRFEWADLDGWVPADRVRASPEREWRLEPTGGSGGGSGCGRSDHPYSYRGPAVVRAGATVHEEATRQVWGRFVLDTEVEIGVRLHDENGFAEVIDVEGLDTPECGSLEFDHAMVPLDAVILP